MNTTYRYQKRVVRTIIINNTLERERERGQSYALPYVPGEDNDSPLFVATATRW